MLKMPLLPATLVCATKVLLLSTSLMVRMPLVVSGASLSARLTAALLNTAASLTAATANVKVLLGLTAPN